MCDVFLVAVLALSFLTGGTGWGRLLEDGDTGLHTRIGDWILDHGRVPDTDPFSFSRPGAKWVASEWLTGVVFAGLHRTWGLKGIVFTCGVAIALILTILLRTALTLGANAIISLGLALAASNALEIHYHARPHIFTLLLLAVAAWILHSDIRRRTRWVWLLVPVTAVWANLHPGFVIYFACLGTVIAGRAAQALLARESSERTRYVADLRRYTVLGAACFAASLINPYFFGLHREILSYLRDSSIADNIQEFQAPSFRTEPQMYFMAFLFLGLTTAGVLLKERRIPQALLIVALGYASLKSIRHATVFVLIATPFIAVALTKSWDAFVVGRARSDPAAILDDVARKLRAGMSWNSIWAAAILGAIFFLSGRESWPADFDKDLFPLRIIHQHAGALASARVFTTEQWADYLLYVNYPRQRLYFDDRSLYGAAMMKEYVTILSAGPHWSELADERGLEWMLVPASAGVATALRPRTDWTVADEDAKSVLFRRGQKAR